jgi:hypothetical protein
MERFQRRRFQLKERPQDFQHLEKAPEEMTLGELGHYVAKIKSEGYDASRYQVDFHAKIAFPFTSLIMALLGIGVALYQGKHGGIAVGVAVSVALAFIYLLIFQFVLRIGYTICSFFSSFSVLATPATCNHCWPPGYPIFSSALPASFSLCMQGTSPESMSFSNGASRIPGEADRVLWRMRE